jgi:predicted negative regulator of RcsB-dependent stress response
MDTQDWHAIESVKDWWDQVIHKRGETRKALTSFAMLISWKIWKERKARVFQNHASSSAMLVSKIKEEAALWCLAGAKALCNIMRRD